MKKLYKVEVEERSSNKRYECLLLVKNKEEIYDLLTNLNIRVINIDVDNFYFDTKKFNTDQMSSLVDNLYLLVNSGLTLFEAMEFLVFNEQVDKFIRGVVFKGYFLVNYIPNKLASFLIHRPLQQRMPVLHSLQRLYFPQFLG